MAGALVLLVSGCSSSSHKIASPSSPVSSHPTPAITAQPLPTGSIANDIDKRKAIAITACAAISGGWSASGTATNDSLVTATYAITIFFTTAQATVLDYATTTVKVAAGKSQKWSAAALFTAPKGMRCVLRGVG
jgi:hypothetical protein